MKMRKSTESSSLALLYKTDAANFIIRFAKVSGVTGRGFTPGKSVSLLLVWETNFWFVTAWRKLIRTGQDTARVTNKIDQDEKLEKEKILTEKEDVVEY